jgi:hypothetical protein
VNRCYGLENGDLLEETGWVTSSHLSLNELGWLELLGDAWIEPRTFVLRSITGETTRQFGDPWTGSALDDYLYILGVYYVEDKTLWSATIEIGGAFRYETRFAMPSLELTGLTLEAS